MVGSEEKWTVSGIVIHGERRGRSIGYPTANLRIPTHTALPADGVYACLVRLADLQGPALGGAVSIGTNPTFGGRQRIVEVHLLDFNGDLYGQQLHVQAIRRLRDMTHFPDVSALVAAMARDVTEARAIVRSFGGGESPASGIEQLRT